MMTYSAGRHRKACPKCGTLALVAIVKHDQAVGLSHRPEKSPRSIGRVVIDDDHFLVDVDRIDLFQSCSSVANSLKTGITTERRIRARSYLEFETPCAQIMPRPARRQCAEPAVSRGAATDSVVIAQVAARSLVCGVPCVLARLRSAALFGVSATLVSVEVDVSFGLPAFSMVGLPDSSVRESRDRVRSAIQNSGFAFPAHRITVNLGPASVRKRGTLFDLPIAIGVLAASGLLERREYDRLLLAGELSLDGAIHSARGVLPIALWPAITT